MSSPSEEYRIDTETLEELETMVSSCNVDSAHDIFKALADERRILIMRLLGQSDLCVCDLVELFDMEYSKLSYHLKVLKDAGLVSTDRDGNYVTYSPTDRGKEVIEIVLTVC